MCSFESDQCQYVDAVDDGDMLNWTRTKVNAISGISVNYPSGSGMICYKQGLVFFCSLTKTTRKNGSPVRIRRQFYKKKLI